jgi:hypothetical protein
MIFLPFRGYKMARFQQQSRISIYHVNLARPFSDNVIHVIQQVNKHLGWFCMIIRLLGFPLLQGVHSSLEGH